MKNVFYTLYLACEWNNIFATYAHIINHYRFGHNLKDFSVKKDETQNEIFELPFGSLFLGIHPLSSHFPLLFSFFALLGRKFVEVEHQDCTQFTNNIHCIYIPTTTYTYRLRKSIFDHLSAIFITRLKLRYKCIYQVHTNCVLVLEWLGNFGIS